MYSKSPSTPSACTNASQKAVSRKPCACIGTERAARRSWGKYPPSIALLMASWIVITPLLHYSLFSFRDLPSRDERLSRGPLSLGETGALRKTESQQTCPH